MKKWLIFLISLFNILIGINSVNAEELKYDQTKPFEHLTMTNTIDLSDEEVTTLMKKANYTDEYITKYLLRRNYALQNNKSGKYYFVNPGNIYNLASDRIFINLSNENIKQGWIEISNSRDGASTDIYYNIESNDGYTYYTYDYSTTPSTNSSKWFASNNKLFQFTYNSNNVIYNGYNSMCLSYFYETNMKGQLSYKKGAFGGTSDIIVDDVTYSINSMLPITIEDGYHSLKDTKPKIDMNLVESHDTFTKIKISFSTFDNQKYLYFLSTDRENWIDIMENDYEYTSYVNGVLYVIIVDRDGFYESADQGIVKYDPIVSATWTFTGINEMMPDAKVFFQTPDSCKITNKGKEYIICQNLYVEISNYNSIEKYMWQYSFDRENWLSIYTNKFNIEFSENKTVYFKLINPSTKEGYKYFTATITGIVPLPNNLKAYIDMFGEYNKETFSFNIDTYIYNYDSSIYNYFYSIDGINWVELKDSNMLTTSNSLVRHFVLSFYKDLTLYVKVEDKVGNYIHAATYTITYFSKSDVKSDTLDSFDSNSNLVSQVFKPFLEIWNNFKTYSKIFNYLLYVILGSIILLLLKSIRK